MSIIQEALARIYDEPRPVGSKEHIRAWQKFAARAIGSGMGGGAPSLDLNFLTREQTLDSRISFSRASTGTYFGSDGLLKVSAMNLLLYSEDFSNVGWAVLAGVTKTSTNNPEFRGTLTAGLWTSDTGNSQHIFYPASITTVSGVTYTHSIYVKSNGATRLQLSGGTAGFGASQYVNFSLAGSGSVLNQAGGTGNISAVGNGWFRISWTLVASASATGATFGLSFISADGDTRYPTYIGSAGDAVFTAFAQTEAGSVPTAYIPTTATASGAPRFDYDPATLLPRGFLIEEARTNLLRWSRDLTQADWTKSADTTVAQTQTGIDGVANSCSLYTEGSAGTAQVAQQRSTTANTAVCTTLWIKYVAATQWVWILSSDGSSDGVSCVVNVVTGATGTPSTVGSATGVFCTATTINGWCKIILGYTPVSGFAFNAVSIHSATSSGSSVRVSNSSFIIDAIQSELGAFPTSYIPTTTTALTRSSDVASMTGTNFSDWWNATEGTFVAEFDSSGLGTNALVHRVDDNTANERLLFAVSSASTLQVTSTSGGITDFSLSVGAYTQGSVAKNATSFVAGTEKVRCSNGGGVVSNGTNVSNATMTRLWIGNNANTQFINGHIRRLTYYNRRLPDTLLKALTL